MYSKYYTITSQFRSELKGKALEILLRRLVGPHGLLKDIIKGTSSLEDILQPILKPNMGGIDLKIKEIVEKVTTNHHSVISSCKISIYSMAEN